jgi:hypothetical protein
MLKLTEYLDNGNHIPQISLIAQKNYKIKELCVNLRDPRETIQF